MLPRSSFASVPALGLGFPLLIVAAGVVVAACGKTEEKRSTPLKCVDVGTAVGSWTSLAQPDEVLGAARLASNFNFTDGETFSLHRNRHLAQLKPGTDQWSIEETSRPWKVLGKLHAANPEFLLIQGGTPASDEDERVYDSSLEVLNLETLEWAVTEPPPTPIASYAAVVPVGDEFFFWGGYGATSDGNAALFTSGAFYEPQSRTWKEQGGALDPLEYSVDELPAAIDGDLAATGVGGGVFVWGITPDRWEPFASVLDAGAGAWTRVSTDGGPGPRRYVDLVAAPETVYLVGGVTANKDNRWERIRELWRYSLTDDTWEELDVPEWVDASRGAWLDGKLYVFGECDVDAVYDPEDDSWAELPALPLSPQTGVPVVAGGRIFITEVYPHADDALTTLFIYEPGAK